MLEIILFFVNEIVKPPTEIKLNHAFKRRQTRRRFSEENAAFLAYGAEHLSVLLCCFKCVCMWGVNVHEAC